MSSKNPSDTAKSANIHHHHAKFVICCVYKARNEKIKVTPKDFKRIDPNLNIQADINPNQIFKHVMDQHKNLTKYLCIYV